LTFQDLEYEEGNKFIEEIRLGMHGAKTKHLTLIEKRLVEFDHYAKDIPSSLSKYPFRKEYQDSVDHKHELSYNVLPRQSEQDLFKNKLAGFKANAVAINCGIFGNSALKASDVCVAYVPSYSSKDFSEEHFDVISGKFLIANIKHILSAKSYNQRLLLIKDGFEEVTE
jgi:hypothetical protein